MNSDSLPSEPVRCHVYRSSVKDGLYVYVAVSDEPGGEPASGNGPGEGTPASVPDSARETPDPALERLPAPVRRQLGRPALAMTLDLDENRRLGREDVRVVLANLASRGFHVQMPRDIEPIVESVADAAVAAAAARRARERGDGREG